MGRKLTEVLARRNGIKHVDKNGAGHSSQKTAVRAGYLFSQSAKLSEQVSTISAVLASLVRPPPELSPPELLLTAPLILQTELLSVMNQLAERAEALVVEAAKTRGTIFAFRDPLWVTWPLSRFCASLPTSLAPPLTPSQRTESKT